MKHAVNLTLIEDAALNEAAVMWASLPPAKRQPYLEGALGGALRQAVSPHMSRQGAVRIKLLADPGSMAVRDLRRFVADISGQLGHLVPQTFANNRIGLIQDKGKNYTSHRTRGHETNAELAYHSDRSDLNMLLYVRCAQSGGQVGVIGFEEAAAELGQRNPAALATLFSDFPFDLREERIFPTPEWYARPLLWRSTAGLRGHYIRRFINDSQRHADCPRLTPTQIDALNAFDQVLAELGPTRRFSPVPGELLILNNYRVMHARTSYQDTGAGGERRLAIRAWVAPFDSEELPHFLLPIAGALGAGTFRGGLGQGQRYHRMLGRTQTVKRKELAP